MTPDVEAELVSWLRSVPVSPVALDRLRGLDLPIRARSRLWPRLAAAAATATVLVLVAISTFTLPSATPPASATPASVTPLPSATPSASATPGVTATALERCVPSDLAASLKDRGSNLGNGGAIIRVTNVGASPCRLSGYPDLTLIDASGQHVAAEVTDATDGAYLFPAIPVSDVALDTGGTGSIQVGYFAMATNPGNRACPIVTRIELALPGLDAAVDAIGTLSPCNGRLDVSPIHAGADWIGFSGPEPDQTQVNLTSMAWFDRQHGLLVGGSSPDGATAGTVWRTSDGGRTWDSVSVAARALNVVTISGDVAWAGTACSLPGPCRSPLLRSDDGGATWTRIGVQPAGSIAFADPSHGWAIAFPDSNVDPSLLATRDGGRTWNPVPSPCPDGTGIPVAVSFPARNLGWLACNGTVGAGNATKAILRTTDGEHWIVMASAPWPDGGRPIGQISSSGYLTGISMTGAGTGMYWADRGVSERTTDGGATWTGMTATSFDVVIPAFGWAVDERDWLLYVWNGDLGQNVLEESTDGGGTWGPAAGFVPPS